MPHRIISRIVGALALLDAGFLAADSLLKFPDWLSGARLLALAVGSVALALLLAVYIALKLVAAAGRALPGAMLRSEAPSRTARGGSQPQSAAAPSPPPAPAPRCDIGFMDVTSHAERRQCFVCATAGATYGCRVHQVALCVDCVSRHLAGAA